MEKKIAFLAFVLSALLPVVFGICECVIPGQDIDCPGWYWANMKVLDLNLFALFSWVVAVVIFFSRKDYFMSLLEKIYK